MQKLDMGDLKSLTAENEGKTMEIVEPAICLER